MAQHEKDNMEIKIEIDFNSLSSFNLGEIISNIMKYLLHQRYQIPFNFAMFERIVDSFNDRPQNELEQYTELTKYKIERQRELAKKTRDDIQHLNALLKEVFNTNAVKTIRFLFGATAFLPKEVYTVHIPIECLNVKTDFMPISIALLNSIMLKLIANEQLSNVFAHALNPTNIYMDIELWKELDKTYEHPRMQRKTVGELPKSCKNVHINFVHQSNVTRPQLIVYEDVYDISKTAKNEGSNISTLYTTRNDIFKTLGGVTEWWEAFVKIGGLKESENKKLKIW